MAKETAERALAEAEVRRKHEIDKTITTQMTRVTRFERYAANEGWSKECYGAFLGSLLTGLALEVYSQLPASEARDYDKLKEALICVNQRRLSKEIIWQSACL